MDVCPATVNFREGDSDCIGRDVDRLLEREYHLLRMGEVNERDHQLGRGELNKLAGERAPLAVTDASFIASPNQGIFVGIE
jgi:hypothetical protein